MHRRQAYQTKRPIVGYPLLPVCAACLQLTLTLGLSLSILSLPSSSYALPRLGSSGGEIGGGEFRRPVITQPPVDVYSTDGVLEFTCQADGQPKPIIQWYDAQTSQPVVDRVPTGGMTSGIHVNQHYGRLLVSNPTKNHIYAFYCNASNAVGWVSSQPPVSGGLAYLESAFRKAPQDKTAYKYERVILDCEPPAGVPPPKVLWFHNDRLVASSDNSTGLGASQLAVGVGINLRKNKVIGQGSLLIEKADSFDAGIYVCMATNVAGQVRSPSIELKLTSRIRFLETPTDVRVRKGMNAEFRCRVDGEPLVQWSRRSGEGSIDAGRAELTENQLLLKNVQPSDAGTYVCSVPGVITSSAVLIVETPPVFQQTPEDLKVTVGSDAMFHCATTGYPKPSIYWELPNKTPIFPSEYSSKGRYYVHPDGWLKIHDVQVSDTGKYQCTAHSSIDRIHSSANLEVLLVDEQNQMVLGQNTAAGKSKQVPSKPNIFSHLPVVYPPAPIIGLPPMNQTRIVGDLVTLDCELSSVKEHDMEHESAYNAYTTLDQSVQQQYASSLGFSSGEWPVSWYRATLATGNLPQRIDFSAYDEDHRFRLLPGGSLQIMDIQLGDTGVYTCSAKSIVSRSRSSELDSMIVQQSNWTAQLIVVSHLSPLTDDPRLENPLSPPRHLRATNLTDSTVTLTWEDSDSGALLGLNNNAQPPLKVVYWVDFYRADRPLDGWITVERNWPSNWVQIGGLQPNTGYHFLIRPRYETGRLGWASPPIGPLFTLQRPVTSNSRQTGLRDSKQIASDIKYLKIDTMDVYPLSPKKLRVSWTLLDRPVLLSMISGYHIRYQSVPLLQCLPKTEVRQDDTFVKVGWQTRLGENYCSLRISANSDILMLHQRVQELQTLRSEASTMEAKKSPYPPVNETVLVKSISIEVDQFQQITNTKDTQSVVYHGQDVLTDLNPFHCYSVSIQPFAKLSSFENIEGRQSATVSVLTYESFPSQPPTHVSARWRTAEELELSWLPPPVAFWNGILTGYIIYAYDDTGRNHQTFNITVHERMTRMSGLGGPKVILVQMAAVNCHGIGLRSEPLRLEPEFKKQGLGAGWGFNPRDGSLVARNETVASNESNSAAFSQLYRRPWFMVVIVIGVLLWFTFLILIIYLCRRQRNALNKGVLIPNSPQCDISNSQLGGVYSDRCAKDRNALQLEPLIRPGNSLDPDDSFINSSQSMHTTPARYTSYSVVPNQNDFGQQGNRQNLSVGNGTTRRPVHPVVYSPGAVNHFMEPTVTNIYATAGPKVINDLPCSAGTALSACHQATLFTAVPNNCVNFQPVTTMLTSNCTARPVGFRPPQSSMILQPSDSIGDFTIIPVTHPSDHKMIPATERPVAGGLPPIAPVARLGVDDTAYRMNNFAQLIDETQCSSVSVAPYATASIIQNNGTDETKGHLGQTSHHRPSLSRPVVRDAGYGMDCSQRSGLLYPLEVIPCQADSTACTSPSTDDQLRRSVSKTQSDCATGRINTDILTNGGSIAMHDSSLASGSHASPVGLHQGSTEEHSSRSSSNVGTSAAPASRSMCGGNILINRMIPLSAREDEIPRPSAPYSGTNDVNSSGTSSNHTGGSYASHTNGTDWNIRSSNLNDDKLTFFSESYIPPPPQSPPPPAPKSGGHRQCNRQSTLLDRYNGVTSHEEDYYQLSEHSSSLHSCSQDNSHSEFEPSPLLADRASEQADEKQTVRQCRQVERDCQPDRFTPIQTTMSNRFPVSTGHRSIDMRCDIVSESPYCVSVQTDDPHNSTYTQVC